MIGDCYCYDCGMDLEEIKQYFMVKDHLWQKYGVGKNMLCMDCFEKKIGRRLLLDDFSYTSVNAIYLAFNRERHLPKF